MCIDRAGVLTYFFPQISQDLAFSAVNALCVCLWRERLELEAKYLPHSMHWWRVLRLQALSDRSMLESASSGLCCWKTLMSISGREMSEQKDDVGETGAGELAEVEEETYECSE